MEAVNKSGFCSAPNNRPKTSERPEKPTSRVGPPPPGHQEAPLCASARAATPRRVYLDRLSFYSIRNSRASRRRSENFVGEEQGGKLVSFPLFFFWKLSLLGGSTCGPADPFKGNRTPSDNLRDPIGRSEDSDDWMRCSFVFFLFSLRFFFFFLP